MSTQAESRPQPRPVAVKTSSKTGWLIGGALLLLFVIGAAAWWRHEGHVRTTAHSGNSGEGSQTASSDAVRVEVEYPKVGGIIHTSTQTGSVHAFEDADLYAKVSGYLKSQKVDIGDRVKRGEVLAEIDDPEIVKEADRAQAALDQAKSMVSQAEARIETAKADEEAARATVKEAEAQVERYAATRKYRQKELNRYTRLAEQRAVQQAVVDEAEDHYESAVAAEHAGQAAVITARAKLSSAHANVDQAKADLLEAKANVQVAEATLAKAKVLVGYLKIVSPYDGVITQRNFHRGAFIRSAEAGGALPLLTVARTDLMRVVTHIPDRDVPYVDVGDRAVISLDALPGKTFEGKVSRFAETEDPQSRTMRTEVDLANPDGKLREGMYGIATIYLEPPSKRLTIPSAALVEKSENGKASVFVVRDGKARQVPVTVGADDAIRVEILSGLSPDDEVILTKGAVSDGTPVAPVRASTSSGAAEPSAAGEAQ